MNCSRLLSNAILTVIVCTIGTTHAQSNAKPYPSTGASVYNDIVGEFEPADDWIVKPDLDLSNDYGTAESELSATVEAPPKTAPVLPIQKIEVFGANPPQRRTWDWHRTDAGQLWDPKQQQPVGWSDGPMRLQFGIDLLYFSRGTAADNVFASNTAGENFNLADIDVGTKTTARYRVLLATDGGTGFELTGYDFQQFGGSLRLEGEGITPVFFGGIPREPVESYDASYSSRLKSYEANVWARRGERLKIGSGLRFIGLDENFDIEFLDNSGSAGGGLPGTPSGSGGGGGSSFSSRTENSIFGGQVMATLYRPVKQAFYLEGGAAGGFGFNRIATDSDTGNQDSNTTDTTGIGFIGFNAGMSFRPTDGLTFRAGYEGLFLSTVGLGPDQSAAINSRSEAREIVTTGLYFGGAYFGGTFAF